MSPQPLKERYRFAHSAMIALLVIFSGTCSVYADPPIVDFTPAEASDTNEARRNNDAIDTDDPAVPGPYEVPDPPDVPAEELDEMAEAEEGEQGLSLIPEPSTLIMLALAALTAYLWRVKW